jgi:AcrR family transcriptional regulator
MLLHVSNIVKLRKMPKKTSSPETPTTRPRVRRGSAADADKLRQELVDAALDLFTHDGLDAVTMRAVAQRVGVSAMTPYRYFDDKGALLRGIWHHVFAEVAGIERAAGLGATRARDRLRAELSVFVDYWEANPQHYKLVYTLEQTTRRDTDGALTSTAVYADMLERSLALSRQLAEEIGGDPANAKLASDMRLVMISGYLHSRLVNRRFPWGDARQLRETWLAQVVAVMENCLMQGIAGETLARPVPTPVPRRAATRATTR